MLQASRMIGVGVLCIAVFAARPIAVFATAVAFGFFVAIQIGEGNPWIAAAVAIGILLFVVLPVRLWWLLICSPYHFTPESVNMGTDPLSADSGAAPSRATLPEAAKFYR